MKWKWLERAGVILGIAVSAIALAQVRSGVRKRTGDAVEWLYPVWVVVILVLALVASIGWILYARRGGRSREAPAREHDAAVVREVRSLVGRNDIEWLRGHDFGGSWRRANVLPHYELAHSDHVEQAPHDCVVRKAHRALLDATKRFTHVEAHQGFSERGNPDWRYVGLDGNEIGAPGSDTYQLWEKRQEALNTAADAVVVAYDKFIVIARDKFLLAD